MYKKQNITKTEYNSIHKWLTKHFGQPKRCDGHKCSGKSIKYEWALKEGYLYERNIDNFDRLCKSCHSKRDVTDIQRESAKIVGLTVGRFNRVKASLAREKPVIGTNNIGKNMFFPSAKKASIALNRSIDSVSKAINRNNKCAGIKWKYA